MASEQAEVVKLIRKDFKLMSDLKVKVHSAYSAGGFTTAYVTIFDAPPDIVDAWEKYLSIYEAHDYNGMTDGYDSKPRVDHPTVTSVIITSKFSDNICKHAYNFLVDVYVDEYKDFVDVQYENITPESRTKSGIQIISEISLLLQGNGKFHRAYKQFNFLRK